MADPVRIPGLDKLITRFKDIKTRTRPMMEEATRKGLLYVHSTIPPYPAASPDSSYQRTGDLGRKITTEVRPLGVMVVGVIGTNVVYAPWTISEEKVGERGPQAWFHEGRWWTLQDVVRKAKAEFIRIYEETIRSLIGS
jgi:hypothetical protein